MFIIAWSVFYNSKMIYAKDIIACNIKININWSSFCIFSVRVNMMRKSSGWRGTLKRKTWLDLRCCGGVDFQLRNLLISQTIEGPLGVYMSIKSNTNYKQQIVSLQSESMQLCISGGPFSRSRTL